MTGATTASGYGWQHQKARKEWAPHVEAGECVCTRCGDLIEPGEPWHLDHNDTRTGYLGAAHARCNVVAGAIKGASMRQPERLITSRQW